MKQQSIARRLIVSVLLIQLISALGVVAATLAYERHTHFQAFDIMLRGRADSLLGAVQDADDEADNIMLDRTNLQLPSKDLYEVQDGAGRVLGRSENWAETLGSGPSPVPSTDGIFRAKRNGVRYRLIRIHGIRMVDPGEGNGGKARSVVVIYGSSTAGVWEEIREAVAFYAAASCLLLILTGSLVSWMLHRGLSPLRELAEEAEGLSAEQWNFSSPQIARSTRELAPLATALEAAVKRLERSFDQQRHFVSDAAHELKTAVAVVKSSLQLLTMRQRSAEEYQAGLDRSLADCERMEEIVAKMLTLARLESRSFEEAPTRSTDLAECAKAAVEQIEPFAHARQVTIITDMADIAPVALSRDEGVLLCSNLLMNSIQHSDKFTEINLSVRTFRQNQIELRIDDQGEGIEPAILPHVFERFYRGDPSRARKTGGTGLGLAICKAIAQKAGGTIRIESTKGLGTVAVVLLPKTAGPTPEGSLIPSATSSA